MRAAVGSLGSSRIRSSTFVRCALTVARRSISGGAVEVTRRVVTRFGLPITQPGSIVSVARGKAGLAAARCRQLVRAGVLAILGGLGAIIRGDLAVVDGLGAAVRSLSASRIGTGAFVRGAPAVARRAIACGAVEISGRIVARFGLSITPLRGEVARPRSHPGGFPVFGGLRAIISGELAVVDRLGAVGGSFSAPRICPGALVRCALAVAGRAIPGGAIEIARRVVACFGLAVAQSRCIVTFPRGEAGLAAAHRGQLVGPGILAVPGGLRAIIRGDLAIDDGLGPVVGSPLAARGRLDSLVRCVLTVARRTIPSGAVEITRRVVTCFRFAVTQAGGDVPVLRSQPGLPAPDAGQLVGTGILAVSGGLRAIFSCDLAVVDGLRPVVRRPRVLRRSFAVCLLTLSRGAIDRCAFEIAGGTVTRFGLPVSLLGLPVSHVRRQIAIAAFNIAFARGREGILILNRPAAVLIGSCLFAVWFRHVGRLRALVPGHRA